MEKIAYIDESGNTGYTKKSTKYFIVTAVIVEDAFMLRRIAKKVHNFKINKNKTSILHAYNEDNVVKNKLIKEVKKNRYKMHCIYYR